MFFSLNCVRYMTSKQIQVRVKTFVQTYTDPSGEREIDLRDRNDIGDWEQGEGEVNKRRSVECISLSLAESEASTEKGHVAR